MKDNFLNQETIEGYLYDYDLTIKTVKNQQSANFGKEFIQGTVDIATDEAGLNVLTVHYTYITEITSNGKTDSRFSALKRIIDSPEKTWIKGGKENALKIKINSSAALNDFYPQGGDQLVSQPRNESGFISFPKDLTTEEDKRNTFKFDVVINGVTLVDANPETETEEYVKLNAAIFNFRKDILPFPLIAKSKPAINYFMGLEASPSEPIFTQVWGNIINSTIKVKKVIESAFGEPMVDVSDRSKKEWIVTGAIPEPYVFDTEETITKADLTKAMQDRNVYLEDVKSRAKEYYSNKGNAVAAPAPEKSNTQIPVGGFNF